MFGVIFLILMFGGISCSKECPEISENCVCDDSEGYLFFDCGNTFEISILDNVFSLDCKNNVFPTNILKDSFKEMNISSVEIKHCKIPSEAIIREQLQGIDWTKVISRVSREESQINSKFYIFKSKADFKNLPNLENLTIVHHSSYQFLESENLVVNGAENLKFLKYQVQKFINISLEHNNLQILDLSGNGLHYFPNIIFNNRDSLQQLIFQDNCIETITNSTFESFKKLEVLNLRNNSLITFEAFSSPNLISLDISENEKLVVNNFELFKNLMNLKFERNQNKLDTDSYLPENFKNIKELELTARENILNKIPKNLLNIDSFPNLENLSIIFNDIHRSHQSFYEFKNNHTLQSNLKYLKVNVESDYKLLSFEVNENSFNKLENLEYLILSGLNLEVLPENVLMDQTKLLEIDFSRNNLQYLPDHLFRNNAKLQLLDISGNHINTLAQNLLKPLLNLVVLDVSRNRLRSFPGALISNLQNLRILDLSSNVIQDIDIKTCLETLQKRKTSAVDIYKSIPNEVVSRLPSIRDLRNTMLNLKGNLISTVKIAELFSTLNLTYYRKSTTLLLDSLEQCSCEAIDIRKFLWDRNQLDKLNFLKIDDVKCKLPKEDLLINYSDEDFLYKLTECPNNCNCFKRCFDATHVINCTSRDLTKIPDLPKLAKGTTSFELDISFNSISKLSFANKANSVSKILASNNRITDISSENLPQSLKILDVTNNKLSKLSSSFFKKLQDNNIKTYLSGNDWRCDCEDQSFFEFTRNYKYLVIDYKNVKCYFKEYPHPIYSEVLECKFDVSLLIIGALSVALAISTIFLLFLIFKMEIKTWLFNHNFLLSYINDVNLVRHKRYDAFICYSEMDSEYVLRIVEKLESYSRPYKVCLYFGDLKAGQSKSIIFILTPSFMTSTWARSEFRTAHLASMEEGGIRFIVILCCEIESLGELDEELEAYLNTNAYLIWGESGFWRKLRYELPFKGNQEEEDETEEIELQTV